jgi:hypothetical protein
MTYFNRALRCMLGHVGAVFLLASCFRGMDIALAVYLVYVCVLASFGVVIAQYLDNRSRK